VELLSHKKALRQKKTKTIQIKFMALNLPTFSILFAITTSKKKKKKARQLILLINVSINK
jgi:hypothetical protein